MTASPIFQTAPIQDFFAFPFKDPQWKNKFLLTSLFIFGSFIVPIVPWLLVIGYQAEIMRRAARGDTTDLLPEWNEWGPLMTDGLRLFGVAFLVNLPVIVLMFGAYALYFIGLFASMTQKDPAAIMGSSFLSMGVFFLVFLVMFVYQIIAAVFLPPALTHAAVNRQFSAAFRIKEWWPVLRANWRGYVVAWVLLLGVFFLIYYGLMILYMSMILCVLIPLAMAPFMAYMTMLSGALLGTVYREGLEKLPPAAANLD